MDKSYLKAVEKKLKLRGLSEEEILVEIKKIINPNIMENEEIKTEEGEQEVLDTVEETIEETPVIEEEVVEETPIIEEEVDKVEEEE